LVIEPGLTAADKAAGAAASPTGADVTADVEPGPVIKRDQWRGPVQRSRYDISGISHNWHRYQRRHNNADLQEPEHTHEIAPSNCGQKGTTAFRLFQCRWLSVYRFPKRCCLSVTVFRSKSERCFRWAKLGSPVSCYDSAYARLVRRGVLPAVSFFQRGFEQPP